MSIDANKESDSTEHHDDLDIDELDDDLNNTIYDIAYNSGYGDGYKEGQTNLALDIENLIYNNALAEIMEYISGFDFDYKNELLTAVSQLKKT